MCKISKLKVHTKIVWTVHDVLSAFAQLKCDVFFSLLQFSLIQRSGKYADYINVLNNPPKRLCQLCKSKPEYLCFNIEELTKLFDLTIEDVECIAKGRGKLLEKICSYLIRRPWLVLAVQWWWWWWWRTHSWQWWCWRTSSKTKTQAYCKCCRAT